MGGFGGWQPQQLLALLRESQSLLERNNSDRGRPALWPNDTSPSSAGDLVRGIASLAHTRMHLHCHVVSAFGFPKPSTAPGMCARRRPDGCHALVGLPPPSVALPRLCDCLLTAKPLAPFNFRLSPPRCSFVTTPSCPPPAPRARSGTPPSPPPPNQQSSRRDGIRGGGQL